MPLSTNHIDADVSADSVALNARAPTAAGRYGRSERNIVMNGIVAGGIYGGLECLLVYPSIYVKTQLQLEYGRNIYGYKWAKIILQSMNADHILLKYDGPMDCIRRTYERRGIRGFYTGCLLAVLGSIPKVAVRCGTNEAICVHLEPHGNPTLTHRLFAGTVSAILESVLVCAPLDTVTTHMIHKTNYIDMKLSGAWHAYRSIVAENGVAGLYRGTASTIVRQVSVHMIRMLVYEVCRNAYAEPDQPVPIWLIASAGGLAGVISVSCTAPVDLVKTRMQGLFGSRYTSYWECIQTVWHEEGAKAFCRGTGPRMVRQSIDMAMLHLMYEYMMNSLQGVLQ